MFNAEKSEYTSKTLRLPTELVAKLETLAHSKQVTLSQLIAQCCKYALNNLEE